MAFQSADSEEGFGRLGVAQSEEDGASERNGIYCSAKSLTNGTRDHYAGTDKR